MSALTVFKSKNVSWKDFLGSSLRNKSRRGRYANFDNLPALAS
jgi:hypothetical protein